MVREGQPVYHDDDRVRTLSILGEEVGKILLDNFSHHRHTSDRSWKDMWTEYKSRGEEPIKIYEKTQADPLFMEDCAGTFLLWAIMLAFVPLG